MRGLLILTLALLVSSMGCATKRGPKAAIATDVSTGIIRIPVDYLGGVSGHDGKESGVVVLTNDETSFRSKKGEQYYVMPLSSITDVQVSSELDRSVRNFLLLGIGGLFFKDKHEYLSIAMNDPEKNLVLTTYYAIKVGTANHVLSAFEAKTGKQFEQRQPVKQIG